MQGIILQGINQDRAARFSFTRMEDRGYVLCVFKVQKS